MKLLDSVKSSWTFFFEESSGDIIWKLKGLLGDVSYCPEDILAAVFERAGLTEGASYSQYLRHYVDDDLEDYSDAAMEDDILLGIVSRGVKAFSEDDIISLCERIGLVPVDVRGFKSALSSEVKSSSSFFLPALALSLQREDVGLVPALQMGMEISRDKDWEALSQKFHSSPEYHVLAILIALHRDGMYVIQNAEEAIKYADMLIRLDTVHQGDDRVRALLLALMQVTKNCDEQKLQEYAKQNKHLLVTGVEETQISKLAPWFTAVENHLRALLPEREVSLDELGPSWGSLFPVTPGAEYIFQIPDDLFSIATKSKKPYLDFPLRDEFTQNLAHFKDFIEYMTELSGHVTRDNVETLLRILTGYPFSTQQEKLLWDGRQIRALLYIIKFMFPSSPGKGKKKYQPIIENTVFDPEVNSNDETYLLEQPNRITSIIKDGHMAGIPISVLKDLYNLYPTVYTNPDKS